MDMSASGASTGVWRGSIPGPGDFAPFGGTGPRPSGDERRKRRRSRGLRGAIARRRGRRGIAIGAEIPRAAVAILPVVPIAVRSFAERAILTWPAVGKAIALPILAIGEPAAVSLALAVALERLPFDVGLRSIGRHVRLRGKRVVLLVLIAGALCRRGEAIGRAAEIIVVIILDLAIAGRPLLTALGQSLRGLGRGDQAEVMFRVLQVILGCDRVAASVGVAGQLKIFLRHVMRVAANLDVRSVELVRARQRVGPAPVVIWPAAHPLVLTWSHCLFR